MAKGTIHIEGVIGQDTTLLDVIREFKSYGQTLTSVEVLINSPGGGVDSGKAIYKFLKNLSIPVITVAKMAYSIASVIYMAGDERLVEEGEDRLMIHLPWSEVAGDATHLEGVAKELRQIEKDLREFYSGHVNIDEETINEMLVNETYLSSAEALELGFSTGVLFPLKAVAILDNNKKNKENKMTKNEKNFFQLVKEFFTNEVKNLVIQDANGDEINFTELADDEVPTVRDGEVAGSMAVDAEGVAIEGERVATNGDVWVFEAGELISITVAEVEETIEEVIEEEVVVDEVETVNEEVDVQAIIDTVIEGVSARMSVENEALRNEITNLKKMVGTPDVSETRVNQNNNTTTKNTVNYLTSVFRS